MRAVAVSATSMRSLVTIAAMVTGWLTPSPGWAQTTAPRLGDDRIVAEIHHPPPPRPLADAARAAVTAADLEQTAVAAPTTPAARRHGCAKKVVQGALYGAGAGAVYVVARTTNGSDSDAPLVKAFAGLGAIIGALAGAIVCAL